MVERVNRIEGFSVVLCVYIYIYIYTHSSRLVWFKILHVVE